MRYSGTVWAGLTAVAILFIPVGAALAEGETIAGERLDPSTYGPQIIESMDEVIARHRAAPPTGPVDPNAREFRYGSWVVPSRRATTFPHSGSYNVVNKWGDTRMGIGFPNVVDVHGAYFAGQAGEGAWATGLRVAGYLEGEEVASTDWFRDIGDEPKWLEMNLCGVDRIVILSEPVLEGGGWYGMDDLTFTVTAPYSQGPTILDFEDLSYNTTLSGSLYAGLTWEWGTGFEVTEPVHAPQVPPDIELQRAQGEGEGAPVPPRTAATIPDLDFEFLGVIRGDANSWSYPPDSIGAVGLDQYVETVNRNFAVYDKATGDELLNVTLGSFLPGSNGDPRVLFDQHSQRWIVLVTDFSAGARIYLAVSTTRDAMGDWFKTNFVTAQGADAGKWPDYPTLGVDAHGIYTAAYMVGGSYGMTLFAIDKAPLIAPEPYLGTITAFRELPWEGAIQPAHTYGTPEGEYCVTINSTNRLRVRRVNPPLTSPTLTQVGYVTVLPHNSPPDAPALGSSTPLDTVGDRLMMAVYRDGSLWTAHTVDVGGRAACRWYQLDPVTPALRQSGTVSDPVRYYFFPSIMVNRYGHVAMGFTGSSSSEYAGAYYTGRRVEDPPGEMGFPRLYKAGVAPQNNIDSYGRNRWGDYSQTTLDPDGELRFWTIQEYAHANNVWGTRVGVLNAGDCNNNDIPDKCDLACGEPGGECDVPGCGTSGDCNENTIPDECDTIVGACCFPDGSCCDVLARSVCDPLGTYYGDGVECSEFLDPPCLPTETRVNCELSPSLAFPGGSVTLELEVMDVEDLFTYKAGIGITRTAGTGTAGVTCPGGVVVDDTRPDYVFQGLDSMSATDCGELLVYGTLISGGGVNVGSTPKYLGTFTLDISPDATPGSEFEISVLGDPYSTFLRDSNNETIRLLPGPVCSVVVADPDLCYAPDVSAGGSRTVVVTPVGAASQALLVTGDPDDPSVSCVAQYVQADGTVGPAPMFQTPGEWGVVAVRGLDIIPDASYNLQADCGSLGDPELSEAAGATTWVWGDVRYPPNGLINIDDVLMAVNAFTGDFTYVTVEQADLDPCTPDQFVNIGDVLRSVQAFQGGSYLESGCPMPCP
jgi:hypothetical protein